MSYTHGNASGPVRLVAILNRQKVHLYSLWFKALQESWGGKAEPKLRRLKNEKRLKQDLLALILAALSEHGKISRQWLDSLFSRFQLLGLDYSLSDFFLEISSLTAAIQQVLQNSPGVNAAETCAFISFVRTQFDDLVAEVLQSTSESYQSIIGHDVRGFCCLDPDGAIIYANKEMQRLVGLKTLKGERLDQFFQGQEQDFVRQAALGKLEPKLRSRPLKLIGQRRAPLPVGAEIGPIVSNGEYRGGFAWLVDISQPIKAQHAIWNKSLFGIIEMSSNENLTFVNHKALEMLGLKTWKGKTLRDLLADDKTYQLVKKRLAQPRKGLSGANKTELLRSDNHTVPVEIYSMPTPDLKGNTIGSVAVIKDLAPENVMAAIHQKIETETEGPRLLTAVAQEVASIVPYDSFDVSVFSDDLQHLRRLFFYTNQGEPPRWDFRWWPLPPEVMEWTKGHRKISTIDNLEVFFSHKKWGKLLKQPEIQAYLQAGFRSLIRVPIFRGNRIAAAVTLSKKVDNYYCKSHKKLLEALPLDKAVFVALDTEKKRETDFRFDLIKKISTQCLRFKDVAQVLVNDLVKQYGWSNVALFKAEEDRGVLRLLNQRAKFEEYRRPKSYEQDLDKGILGHLYNHLKPVNIGDIRAVPEFRALQKTGPGSLARSYLCVHITTREDHWLIVVEDSQINAFSREDLEALEIIAQEVSSFLERSWLQHCLECTFRSTSDAVIRTDKAGKIKDVNRATLKLLGYDREQLSGSFFHEYFLSPEVAKEVLNSPQYPNSEVTLKNHQGKGLNVMLSGLELPEEFSTKVFIIKDLSLFERLQELEYLGTMYNEIATQLKTPLSLIFSWLSLLKDAAPPESQAPTLERIRRQMRKLELTCNRLSLYDYDASQGLVRYHEIALEIPELLNRIQEEFPVAEWNKIDIVLKQPLPTIRGDMFQLIFCLETILSYLIRFLPENEKIDLRITPDANWLIITITGLFPEEEDVSDAKNLKISRTLVEMALGASIIRQFLHNHHGIFHPPKKARNWIEFRLDLPIPPGARS